MVWKFFKGWKGYQIYEVTVAVMMSFRGFNAQSFFIYPGVQHVQDGKPKCNMVWNSLKRGRVATFAGRVPLKSLQSLKR